MSDILEIHEFFVEGGSEKKSHVLLHISEPSSAEEKRKGYFFALTEVNHGTVDQIKEIQRMIDEAEADYFTTDSATPQDAFEHAVREANRRGHHILEGSGTRVHCFLGILSGTTLLLATHGNPAVGLLYRRGEETEYTPIGTEAEENADRLFSSVLSGSVGSGDIVWIATTRVGDYFASDRVRKLFAGRSAKDGAEHIEKVLGSLRDGHSYGGILLNILPKNSAPKTGPRPKYLIEEEPGERKNTPTGNKDETNYRPRRGRTDSLPTVILVGLGRALVVGARKGILWCARAGRSIGRAIIFLIVLTTNKGGHRELVLADARQKLHAKKERLAHLPLTSKLLLGLTIISACVFVGSMVYFRWDAAQQNRAVAYRNLVQGIRDKKDAAEASMIYGDDAKALTLVVEANTLLTDIPRRTDEEKDTAGILTADLERLLMKLRKWSVVQSERFVVLSDDAEDIKPRHLVRIDNQIMAYGPDDSMFYAIRLDSGDTIAKSHKSVQLLRSASTPKEQDTVIFAASDANIAAYQKNTSELVARDISFPEEDVRIADLFVYNQRLFTLAPGTNQIYKHAKTQTGYDRGIPWVKDEAATLADAVALAIDGDIFVLTASGVRKFANGKEQSFSVSGLDPALINPASIWTYNDVNLLYILESANKRLIVLDKSGKLMKQYTDTAWKNPTGMVVDEAKKTAYILDSNIIYRLSLE